MTNPYPSPTTAAAATHGAPAAPTLWAGDREHGSDVERQQLIARARDTDATRQLEHCLTGLTGLFDRLAWQALVRLAANEPLDPNDRDSWQSTDSLGRAILARHGLAGGRVGQLSLVAVELLACRQRQADHDVGLDWSVVTAPVEQLDDRLKQACQAAPVDLTDPRLYAHRSDQRIHLAARFGLAAGQADDLSRWSLEHPDSFDAEDLRSWRIASDTWLSLAAQQLEPVDRVDRPVGLFVVPDLRGRGWQLVPVLSVDMIRLTVVLGGWVERELTAAWIPADHVDQLVERVNVNTLHAGPKENLDLAGKLAGALHTELGHHVNVGVPADKRDRWGRLLVSRQSHDRAGEKTVAIRLRVVTFPARGYGQRTLGAQRMHAGSYDRGVTSGSAVMELGEAVGTAVQRELPLLLSTEAAGKLADQIRVGRTKGRPGAITITQANGVSATTRRLVADQALGELRRFKAADANVKLDAGARQLIRMTQARPLADDPVLLGRQQQIAALKVVGSGVDASSVGTGKCVAADTLIYVNGTLTAAQDIWKRHGSADRYFDGEGWWVEPVIPLVTTSLGTDGQMRQALVTRIYRQWISGTVREVRLDDGSRMTITPGHHLLRVDGWTNDIHVGDWIAVPRRLKWTGRRIDPDVIELLAWQIAEGHEPHGDQGTVARVYQADTQILDHLRRLARRIEGRHDVRMNGLPIKPAHGDHHCATLCIGSRGWRRFLEQELGYRWGRLSAEKKIPDAIVSADDATLRTFLRAFFDAEASVSADRCVLEIMSASQHVMQALSVMCRRLGIWLRWREKTSVATNGRRIPRTYYRGYIAGPSLRTFSTELGFTIAKKADRLASICLRQTNTNVEGVPVRDLLDTISAAGFRRNGTEDVGHITGTTVGRQRGERVVTSYRELVRMARSPAELAHADPRVRARLKRADLGEVERALRAMAERLDRDVHYARVVSVEATAITGWVYDLEIADHHNFVAGGMLAHNTITSGRALAQRAATTARLRAMIIAEGRLLSQWRDELTVGAPRRGLPPLAPNVRVEVLDDRRPVAAQIRQFDQRLADRGGVMLVANSILDRYATDLQVIAWHVLFADEALRYANPATDAHQALRKLRFGPVADCWLLTATPRGKTAEHLDVLVGLAVGDEAMITERLATREGGDLMDEINAHRLRVAYGPHLVRVTRKDMQRWMPQVRPAKPLAIDPDPALGVLLDAIRQGGREAYRRLLEVLRELKTLEAGTLMFKAALAELSRAQGVVLGNVGVFVDASVDPETLTRSKAALAQALVRQGLVAEAMRGGGDGLPLLRGITAQTLAGVAAEQQAIVFSERVWCLRQLAQTLNERHGVRAHVADGTITTAEFEDLKQRFCAGEFPVLCLSRIGHEGHNLQNSSTIVHLDLPWVPTGLEQRVGRAARPGAARGWVDTYIPYIRGGGVEHIVSVLSPRGAEHHQVLDSFEGVAANESTIAGQLGEIASQVAEDKKDAGYAVTAARLKVAASVFGA